MTVLPIRTLPDPMLRQKAKRVRAIDNSIKTLIADMRETLHADPGRVGLAAPQVGVSLRVVVIGIPDEEDIILINPEGKQSASSYLPTIAVDGVMGGRIAGEHLIGLGHKRIAYVGRGPVGELQRARLQGLREAFADAGLKFDPSLVVSEGRGGKAGYLGVRRLLSQGNLPSAIFCYHDLSAYGAMEALKEAGLRVPDDVSVVGFDDIFMSRYVSLTTLAQPFADMGRLAAQVILERLTNQIRTVALCRPLLLAVDGLSSYVGAFQRAFRTKLPRWGHRGRARLRPWTEVAIVQVVKQRRSGKLTIDRRIVQGGAEMIARLIQATQGHGSINTAYIERLNATFRARITALVRRGRVLAC